MGVRQKRSGMVKFFFKLEFFILFWNSLQKSAVVNFFFHNRIKFKVKVTITVTKSWQIQITEKLIESPASILSVF